MKTIIGMNHVGVAVRSIEKHLVSNRLLYEGFEIGQPIINTTQQVKELFLRDGDRVIELLEPLSPESPISGFLARNRDGGPIHIGYDVTDIAAAIREAESAGGRLLAGPVADIAFDQRPIAFVYLGGQISEFIEVARDR
ncbi:MAG: VOC family protein [Betaproteobacteria bacterium]